MYNAIKPGVTASGLQGTPSEFLQHACDAAVPPVILRNKSDTSPLNSASTLQVALE